jgi:hypothetical protein
MASIVVAVQPRSAMSRRAAVTIRSFVIWA